ncbi:SagB-type dehydrogenase family enzyme [Anaerobacterium chartisolvens]|uniref:SagB-type dehydrogenase family enzyme n=1 Tax=Anaerobacterium chartisolvens TaxID=1297424 RepID=A0A369B508_9FIRM|nr:SagB/ThcOx family dehydrogenase [Anaerobacterium chartisolvens]RCX16521.1 SagB-type dehydrogenase family enzyme [Anaerobacterium chartisolvens]
MMEIQTSQATYEGQKKYYWSPAVRWEKTNMEVRIEMFSYKDFFIDMFPQFYFLTQKGISLSDIMAEFSEFDAKKLFLFLQDLIKKRILVSSILSPAEVFYLQNHLFKNEYSEKIKYNAEELNKFKKKHLNRAYEVYTGPKIELNKDEVLQLISRRRTCRVFDTQNKLPYSIFSKMLSLLRQEKTEGSIRYNYASAGGLYPIDIYVYVKEARVENVNKGLYYYSPSENSLTLIDDTCEVSKDTHYFTNQSIFGNSAFSLFLVYNAEVTMPKYGGMAYLFAAIDSGIIVGTLTLVAEQNNVGLCSIGDLNFKKIEEYFKLNENQVLLHTLEIGLKSLESYDEVESVF